jgi:hypothetical protein
MRRDVTRVLVFKFVVLGLLWYLFFSGVHQPRVDTAAVGQRLGVTAAAAGSSSGAPTLRTRGKY